MFYCEPCRKKNAWPKSIGLSVGCCEVCKRTMACNNVPTSRLGVNKKTDLLILRGGIMWYEDRKTLNEFTAWAVESGVVNNTVEAVLYMMDKPKNWNTEYLQFREAVPA